MTPTSAPSSHAKDTARLQALKTPFIHLLAIRPVSTKFLARQTRSTIEDCIALVQKYGTENRIDREKYDLKDKFYKDLDVWKFPYPTQDDRQAAIDKAISAFDRMRLSRTDKLWQSLLPKEERGKGKCLSKLNLQSGLAGKKPATPRLTMDGADDRKDGDTTGNETDRPKGPSAAAPKKTSTPAAKARAEKEPAKRPPKNKNTNSTLTGRITKKTGGRPPAKAATETKYKSAEFVHDSDESDDEMPDASSPPAPARVPSPAPAPAPAPTPAERPKPVKATAAKKPTQPPAKKTTQAPA
jgi:RNA polymerase II elongation factor ELL